MFILRKNAGTRYVILEACIEHEALFTCEQGRHGHCRFRAFLVSTISTVISNLLSFVLAAPTRTASSTREPSSSPQYQLHPNGSSFIFAFITFLSSSSSSILFSSTLIHPSHCFLSYILNPLYKSVLFRLVFPLVFSSLSFLSILLAFTVSHLSLPSPSFTSRAPPTLSLSLSRGWPKRHECCSRVVRRVPKLSLN